MNIGCYFHITLACREDFKVPCKYLINIQNRSVTYEENILLEQQERAVQSNVFKHNPYSTYNQLHKRKIRKLVKEPNPRLALQRGKTLSHGFNEVHHMMLVCQFNIKTNVRKDHKRHPEPRVRGILLSHPFILSFSRFFFLVTGLKVKQCPLF